MSTRKVDRTLRYWTDKTAAAKAAFEAKWTLLSLENGDPSLAQRLREQQSLFDTACVTGTMDEVEDQGAALVRGWEYCAAELGDWAEAPGAFLTGGADGPETCVLISYERPESDEWVRKHYGESWVWMSPDEVAYLLSLPELRQVLAVKRQFPTSAIQPRAREPDAG